jgi:hypothetical protein
MVAGDACTIEVSASQRFLQTNPAGTQRARFWGASADGSKVFFTSDAELTEDAKTAGNAANLYEYDLETGKLTDLSVNSEPEGAAVLGVVQVSEEGQYVYFVANGVLTDTANAGGERAKQGNCEPNGQNGGSCNLYVYHQGGAEPVKFITTLNEADKSVWLHDGPNSAGPALNTAVVSPSGAELAFVSERSLPTTNFPEGYDNEQAASGAGECEGYSHESNEVESGACREVYLYDAETGGLACASCNPSGAQPVGPSELAHATEAPEDYRPRNLVEGGVLFFDSKDALTGAPGGRENVFEYEGGVVRPISDVAGGYESVFLDASPNGANVFFASADRLLPEDPGGNAVVWDARVDGGFPLVSTPVACESEESCAPPAVTPTAVGAPASATFSGPGNLVPPALGSVKPVVKPKPVVESRAQKLARALKACRRDRSKKKRGACEKSARRRYGAKKKAKHASIERGAGR